MRILLLSLLFLTGCAYQEYEPAEPPSDDCLTIGVCTEMSVLLYDKPENSEFIIDKDGTVNIENSLTLRAQEARILNPLSDSNAEGFNTIRGQIDYAAIFGEGFFDSETFRPKIITNEKVFDNK